MVNGLFFLPSFCHILMSVDEAPGNPGTSSPVPSSGFLVEHKPESCQRRSSQDDSPLNSTTLLNDNVSSNY
ncbi:unnamed protein product [Protopolystoma xenopodis]|uniref:Uncharacterized protein n=1 Tax=Protopolystoma xenopodis TaxID=117903 RepID=A0A3S5B795_9PLAT|nr:unnamed protein product [Protopolystoma xenopodis]